MNSTIKVRYFATFEEQVGTSEETVPLDESTGLDTFLEKLTSRHPEIEEHLEHAAVAKNHETVKPENTTLRPGDELALLPPFGGGEHGI